MVKDRQVQRLWRLLLQGKSLSAASASSNMAERTGRRYRKLGKLPSEVAPEHTWRTRPDPFAEVWPEVHELLEREPKLQAKTLFEWLQETYPGRFADGQLRTFQRGVKAWRATCGPAKEVFFSQVHYPGRLCASDFTHMTSLGVTIGGQPFEHMVYHFVLTYSNWESATLCFSESFESLSAGLQNALWMLGGVPARHRSDRLSAAVNNLSDRKEFTARYESLLEHYGLAMEKINARQAHENGDVEQSHGRFKEAVDQALMLRGSREFASREEYARFLQQLIDRRNAGRQTRFQEELKLLRALPERRQESRQQIEVSVDSGSLIRVKHNVYSVESRLIGERVQVRIYADHLEVWYGQKQVETLPRLRGRKKHSINYRHVIDWLVRKPGAFENYRYQEDLFPTSRFRMAYDALRESMGDRASQQYVQILHLAARDSESAVDEALRVLLAEERPVTFEAVEEFVRREQAVPAATEVFVELTDLACFDELLLEDLFTEESPAESSSADPVTDNCFPDTFTDKEVCDGEGHGGEGCEDEADRFAAGVAPADVSGELRGAGPAGRARDALLRAVPAAMELSTRECEMRRTNRIERLLRQSQLPLEKTLENFDLKRLPAKVARQMRTLLDGSFVDRRENLLVFGKSGSGKTHLAVALGLSACRQGHKVKFYTAAGLVNRLEEAQKQYQLDRMLNQLDRTDLLICDELGYLSFSRSGAELLFQVFADRYERRSLLLTSNLAFSDWGTIFQGERMTAALLDRLTHHCQIFEMNGESYRFRESMKKKRTPPKDK